MPQFATEKRLTTELGRVNRMDTDCGPSGAGLRTCRQEDLCTSCDPVQKGRLRPRDRNYPHISPKLTHLRRWHTMFSTENSRTLAPESPNLTPECHSYHFRSSISKFCQSCRLHLPLEKRLVEIKQDDIAALWRSLLSGTLNLPKYC